MDIKYQQKKSLEQQNYTVIIAHILDSENSPLPEELKIQFSRVVSAAQMLDSFHPSNVVKKLLAKYPISISTARKDVQLAQELFKSKHTFDWDYWQQWQIKDLVEIIQCCKLNGKFKERIAAQKVLREVIGEKIAGQEDPKRMEKNVFYIQLNNNSQTVNIDINKLKGLPSNEIRDIMEALIVPEQTDDQIAEILNT